MEEKTIKERMSELEWIVCTSLEHRLIAIETKLDKLDTGVRILELDTSEELEKIYDGMTVRERLDKLEKGMETLETKVKLLVLYKIIDNGK